MAGGQPQRASERRIGETVGGGIDGTFLTGLWDSPGDVLVGIRRCLIDVDVGGGPELGYSRSLWKQNFGDDVGWKSAWRQRASQTGLLVINRRLTQARSVTHDGCTEDGE